MTTKKIAVLIVLLIAIILSTEFISTGKALSVQPAPATDLKIAGDDISGIWAFFMLDMKAESLQLLNNDDIDNMLQVKHPYVKGIAPRFVWSTLNPAPGEYNWTPVDKVIERASAYNKKVVIRIIGGGRSEWTPGWLWLKTKYVDHLCITKQAECRLPIIWDTEYLSAWTTFVKALGSRYDSNPRVQRVAITNGSGGELYYLRGDLMTNDQINQVVNSGLGDNFVQTWNNILDNYAVSFPTKPLFMDLAPTIKDIPNMKGDDKEEVIANYAISKFGHRLYLQQDGLHENTDTSGTFISHAIMKNHAVNGNIIGFQTLAPDAHGNLRMAFEKALSYPIHYIEVFTKDLQDPDQQDAIRFLYERLKAIPPH
ncbi:MAG: beta-galactosidase [Nitrospirae bacterium]|nr:beta-galactosidase [Nitrospirota bacterium]